MVNSCDRYAEEKKAIELQLVQLQENLKAELEVKGKREGDLQNKLQSQNSEHEEKLTSLEKE